MTHRHLIPSSCLLVLFAACGSGESDHHAPTRVPDPRPVSILVEVYDPVTNFVWENVSVRVVESYQEWAAVTFPSPYADIYLTNADGRVLLDEYELTFVEVGFVEDANGRALLAADWYQDEAVVTLEVSAAGFASVYVDVPLSWSDPDVFVEVPFY
ncbi:MAG: hypothetical protein K8J09_06340 [Planctomycetes bacterium]|nr:hypothetical protein [Planctomycetota bacterium]